MTDKFLENLAKTTAEIEAAEAEEDALEAVRGKIDYKVEAVSRDIVEARLNELGEDGWGLLQVLPGPAEGVTIVLARARRPKL